MTKYEYDEEASERLNVDVVHEVDDSPGTESQWIESMRRLNTIQDPLSRRVLALHQDCGSGSGVCDSDEGDAMSWSERRDWGCETTATIAEHFAVEYAKGVGG